MPKATIHRVCVFDSEGEAVCIIALSDEAAVRFPIACHHGFRIETQLGYCVIDLLPKQLVPIGQSPFRGYHQYQVHWSCSEILASIDPRNLSQGIEHALLDGRDFVRLYYRERLSPEAYMDLRHSFIRTI